MRLKILTAGHRRRRRFAAAVGAGSGAAVEDAELDRQAQGQGGGPRAPATTTARARPSSRRKIAKSKLCYLVEFEDIEDRQRRLTSTRAPKGEDGKIVIPLFEEQTESPAEDCIKVEKERPQADRQARGST